MATETTKQDTNSTSQKDEAANILANQYFNNASVTEALSLVPLNTLLNLVRNQVINQASAEVETMTEEQISQLIAASTQEEVKPEQSES